MTSKRPKLYADANGKPCPYCANPMLLDDPARRPSRDHVVPRSRRKGKPLARGVPSVIMACYTCNHNKGSRLLGEWHAYLAGTRDPRAARVLAFMRARDAKAKPPREKAPQAQPTPEPSKEWRCPRWA